MEAPWLTDLKRIHALASSGLAYHSDDFDQERYAEIRYLSESLLSQFTRLPLKNIYTSMGPLDGQYVTPKTVVRTAVFRQNTILLVKEIADGKWALPGGYADVGLSARENALKELKEEAGIALSDIKLAAVRHKAKGPYEQDVRDFYILIFVAEIEVPLDVSAGMETSDAAFFELNALPPLSRGRTIERDMEDARRALCAPPGSITLD